ncbi:hypothetical protein F4811DRAFT_567046 [Daldinia bambusicola]|nr:hypothetical protein F4811DRAFT_567046 [Daldinia bambusicola]
MRNRKHLRYEVLNTLALTGNGIEFTWRNLIQLSETPWFRARKVEDQIVFPATGYMAIAIKAVSQVTGVKGKQANQLAFKFRNLNISAALYVLDKKRDIYSTAKDLEIHTTMTPRKISNGSPLGGIHWKPDVLCLCLKAEVRLRDYVTSRHAG